jgi:hypothetical protein
VQQTQKNQIFKFPLEIAISFEEKDFQQFQKVYIDKESNLISIPVTSKPSKLALDPKIDLLFEGNLRN